MKPDLQDELFSQMAGPFTGEALFDHMTDLVYFVKNGKCQYVVVNQSLAERCGFRKKADLIGCTADQIYPSPLGERLGLASLGESERTQVTDNW